MASGLQLTLSGPEIEWLLQVLNDVRVGSWIALGSPDPESGKKIVFNEKICRISARWNSPARLKWFFSMR